MKEIRPEAEQGSALPPSHPKLQSSGKLKMGVSGPNHI